VTNELVCIAFRQHGLDASNDWLSIGIILEERFQTKLAVAPTETAINQCAEQSSVPFLDIIKQAIHVVQLSEIPATPTLHEKGEHVCPMVTS
jgi:hypothetical protein